MDKLNKQSSYSKIVVIGVSIAAITASLILFGWFKPNYFSNNSSRLEIYKILLQFLLITTFGGMLLWSLNYWKDQQESKKEQIKEQDRKRDEQAVTIRKLLADYTDAYLSMKGIKRKLRSRIKWYKVDAPFTCEKDDFLPLMDQLQCIQADLERIRDDVVSRNDLFGQEAEIIYIELNYIARYLHDVYEEFERGKVKTVNGNVQIGSDCENMIDFISHRDSAPSAMEYVNALRSKEKEGNLLSNERHDLLRSIEESRRKTPNHRRYSTVASAMADLAREHFRECVRKVYQSSAAPT